MHHDLLSFILCQFGLRILSTEIGTECITVSVSSAKSSAQCPKCHSVSTKVHSSYVRTLADLPFGTRRVVLHLKVRRFFCIEPDCTCVTFTEFIPSLTKRYARRTNQLHIAVREIAFGLGGEEGSRMVKKLRYGEISPDTLLRIIRCFPQDNLPTPRYLGVDDWAMKKGRKYGTILCDLERHTVVDLLPNRTSEVLEKWLKAHPGVEMITRDRSGSYSEGAKQGASDAIQIADRFHLLVNLTETLKQVVQRNPGILKLSQPPASPSETENAEKEPAVKQEVAQTVSAGLSQKQELYKQIQNLRQQVQPISVVGNSRQFWLNGL